MAMVHKASLAVIALLCLLGAAPAQSTLLVPEQYPSIEAAIDAAVTGDTVSVAAGVYHENLDFGGKSIAVRSREGAFATTIRGTQPGGVGLPVVVFASGENREAILDGFTIENGQRGIWVQSSAPTIRNCVIRNNATSGSGGGILVWDGAARIESCIVRDNEAVWFGSGIHVQGTLPPGLVATEVVNCTVYRNWSHDDWLNAAGISNGFGDSVLYVFNTVSRENRAGFSSTGFDIYVEHPGFVAHSNWSNAPATNGNSNADPLLVDPDANDFRLQLGSPCRDTGTDQQVILPQVDIAGFPRVIGTAPDMGAHEFMQGSIFCLGDGSGTPCPCGNEGGQNQGCANGSGQGATLVATESASVASDDLVLHGSGMLPGNAGLFFQGDQSVNGGAGAAFGDGLRCAGGALVRLQTRMPDPSGRASTSVEIAALGGALPGDTRHYQLWYRDAFTSPCGALFNLSNGVQLTWQP